MYLFNAGEVALLSLSSGSQSGGEINREVGAISGGFIPGKLKDSSLPPDKPIMEGLISRIYGILLILNLRFGVMKR